MAIKDQLEAAGYDTSSLNESDLLSKLEQSGYDTSSLKEGFTKGGAKQPIPSDVVNEKPLQDVSVQDALGAPFTAADIAGEKGAEYAASKGVNPTLAAAGGTAVQMAPYIAAAAKTLGPIASRVAQEGIPSAMQTLGQDITAKGEGAISAIKNVGKRIMMGPQTEQTIGLRNDIASLGTQQSAKEAALEELRKQSGSNIESLRNQYNVPQQLSAVEVPKDVNEFADTLKSLGARRPEDVAKSMGLDGLMKLRDTAKATLESGVSKTQAAFIKRGISAIDDAMGVIHPSITDAYKQYGTVQQASDALPGDIATKKEALLKAIRANAPGVSNEKALRRGAGLVMGGGGVGGAALAALHRLGLLGGH